MALILLLATLTAVYLFAQGIYRIYFSPLSHIPGPKLAAATILYEFYYDVILGGQYTFKIIKLHKTYGPIIRISPHEVHIADPDYYIELYASSASGHRRDKYKWFTDSFGVDLSTFSTFEHDLHKVRRGALGVYFSQQNVRKLDGLIRERVSVLVERFRGARGDDGAMNLSHAFAAFTNGR